MTDLLEALLEIQPCTEQREGEYTLHQLSRRLHCSVDTVPEMIEQLRARGVTVNTKPFKARNGTLIELYWIEKVIENDD